MENDQASVLRIAEFSGKSCASMAVRRLADCGIAAEKDALRSLFRIAEERGLMPDDGRVIRDLLEDFGFVMQNSRLEKDMGVGEVLKALEVVTDPACLFLMVYDYTHSGGSMLAYRTGGGGAAPVGLIPRTYRLEHRRVSHVWIRWDDGVDRSPYPRRTVKRAPAAPRRREPPPETLWFRPFQPNPRLNSIGDCVVRGIAGVLGISWVDAMEKLAALNVTTVNALTAFPRVLEKEGFVRHAPIIRNKRRLDGKAFCDEMTLRLHRNERVFAFVGRSHVAAVVPVEDEDGRSTYKILDSWDSSSRPIGEYWVRTPSRLPDAAAMELLAPGRRILHPAFGEGRIDRTEKRSRSLIVCISFAVCGAKRLEADWVLGHCTFPPEAE